MSYADGELSANEAKAVEEILAVNPDARKRLEVFTLTNKPLAELYEQPIIEPIPKRLLDILEPIDSSHEPKKPVSAKGVSQGYLRTFGLRRRGLGRLGILASSMLIIVSAGSGWLLGRTGTVDQPTRASFLAFDGGSIRAKGEFGEALETTPSSTFAAWSGTSDERISFKPVLSFRSKDQQFCRQYELKSDRSGTFAGLACRTFDGAWLIKMHEEAVPAAPQDGRTVPADGLERPLLDALVDRIIDGEALGADEEGKLIGNGWQS